MRAHLDVRQSDHGRSAVVPGPGVDPGPQHGDLFRRRPARGLLRRHGRLQFALNLADDAAGIGFAGDEDGAVLSALHERGVGLQVETALEILGVVTFRAIAREERADLLGIAGRLGGGQRRRCSAGQEQGEQGEAARFSHIRPSMAKNVPGRLCNPGFSEQ